MKPKTEHKETDVSCAQKTKGFSVLEKEIEKRIRICQQMRDINICANCAQMVTDCKTNTENFWIRKGASLKAREIIKDIEEWGMIRCRYTNELMSCISKEELLKFLYRNHLDKETGKNENTTTTRNKRNA